MQTVQTNRAFTYFAAATKARKVIRIIVAFLKIEATRCEDIKKVQGFTKPIVAEFEKLNTKYGNGVCGTKGCSATDGSITIDQECAHQERRRKKRAVDTGAEVTITLNQAK